MPTRKLNKIHRERLKTLGERICAIILDERGYSSLDAFALEYYDSVAKPTLYQVCDGRRDMKISTFFSICDALDINPEELIKKL